MKIAISGGHLTPALAFIDYVKSHGQDEVVFIGREFSQTIAKQKAREGIEVKNRDIPFVALDVPSFSKRNPVNLILDAVRYPVSIIQALGIIIRQRPSVFVSFGGYLAVPIAIACWLLGIPIITHEQTVVGGTANQFIAKLARKVALSFPQSKKYFPAHKTVLTGNPIRTEVIRKDAPQPSWITRLPDKPIVYITGGNQGSYFINSTVSQLLPQLTRKYTVIHACGRSTNQMNYKKELQKLRRQLSPTQQDSFYIQEWISETDLAWVLAHTDLAVTRSGANTVQELIAHQVPALYIPLPFAKNDEQMRNATIVTKSGGAKVIAQGSLTPQVLLETINEMMKTKKAYKTKMGKVTIPTDGAAKLYQLVHSLS